MNKDKDALGRYTQSDRQGLYRGGEDGVFGGDGHTWHPDEVAPYADPPVRQSWDGGRSPATEALVDPHGFDTFDPEFIMLLSDFYDIFGVSALQRIPEFVAWVNGELDDDADLGKPELTELREGQLDPDDVGLSIQAHPHRVYSSEQSPAENATAKKRAQEWIDIWMTTTTRPMIRIIVDKGRWNSKRMEIHITSGSLSSWLTAREFAAVMGGEALGGTHVLLGQYHLVASYAVTDGLGLFRNIAINGVMHPKIEVRHGAKISTSSQAQKPAVKEKLKPKRRGQHTRKPYARQPVQR